jgi:hypothetical protein
LTVTVVLAAVADPIAVNAHGRADELGATVYSDYRTMLEQADIDAVDICLPHHLHKDAIVAAARAGKHVLCEKPLCLTSEEAAEVAAAVEESGITLMCAHNQLDTGYHPTYLLLHLAGGAPVEVASMLSTHRLSFMEGEDFSASSWPHTALR